MKRNVSFYKRIAALWRRISLVDRCLLVLMCVLLAQTVYGLFTDMSSNQSTLAIDAIVRTSAAAIFGYFISGDFTKPRTTAIASTTPTDTVPAPPLPIEPQEAPEPPTPPAPLVSPAPSSPPASHPYFQIIVVFSIGLLALISILCYRNLDASNPTAPAILSQLRDFVSGCVGFLIGRKSDAS